MMRTRHRDQVGTNMLRVGHLSHPGSVRPFAAIVAGAQAVGAFALGAAAVGALAIGAMAIGKLAIGRTRIRRVEIDELVVRRLRVTEALEAPGSAPPEREA